MRSSKAGKVKNETAVTATHHDLHAVSHFKISPHPSHNKNI